LPEGDYDIRLKWGYAPFACPTQLDDINLRDQPVNCKTANDISTKSMHVYPNPANQQVSIALNDKTIKSGVLKIHDLTGKDVYMIVIEENQQRFDLNIEHLNNGVYFISFRNGMDSEDHIGKLIINH